MYSQRIKIKNRIKNIGAREKKFNIGRRVYKSYLKVSDPFHQ